MQLSTDYFYASFSMQDYLNLLIFTRLVVFVASLDTLLFKQPHILRVFFPMTDP